MFESLSGKLGEVFDRLKGRGALSEADVEQALREVRIALLEADVALPVVKDFISAVKERATGHEVTRSVTPGQMVIKIVNDHLIETLGQNVPLDLAATPPVTILMVGLQGSGKTTSTAKIARRLKSREKKKVLLASLDVNRPAAQEQLAVLAGQTGVDSLEIVKGEIPLEITTRAMDQARRGGYDVVMLDSAGRLHVDDELMDEISAVAKIAQPKETLLVADAMTGQDAVKVAESFNQRLPLSGIVLTRVDGDARGGAALSMRAVTGCPIKLLGIGEKLDALEDFYPDRIASRILGMGDVVSLVEKAAETVDQEEAAKLAKKISKGGFDLNDLATQLTQIRKMGGVTDLLGMLPGIGKMKKQIANADIDIGNLFFHLADIDENLIKRQQAILSSMTPKERRYPKLLNASRKKRIASGSGSTVPEINRLLKQFKDMSRMMKKMGKMGRKGMLGGGPPGSMPPFMQP